MVKFPFEVSFEHVKEHAEEYVKAIFSSLESEFLVLPKGPGFIDYSVFETGYEALKRATAGFANMTPAPMLNVASEAQISIIVVRTMLGFTPPEWAYLTTQQTDIKVTQGFVRTLDRKIRMEPLKPLKVTPTVAERVRALIETACRLLRQGASQVEADEIHRLDKVDTKTGVDVTTVLAGMGVPYAMLLYERFLGRPFASHRDSVSELIGDRLESAIEDVLSGAGISYRKTKRAERIPGFDQAPDFIIPSEFNPHVVIEAKMTEDDGTARDKITRIQHLAELSLVSQPQDLPKFEVVACIGGRGFGVRREDVKKLLFATRGKVFTLKTLNMLTEHTRLKEFKPK